MSNLQKEVIEYGWKTEEVTVACKRVAKHVIREIKEHAGKRVLDIGCGNGSLCGVLHNAGFDIVGVENDHKGVQLARKIYPPVKFYKYGVQDDPIELLNKEGDKFDVVVSTEVIEHLFAPQLLLQYSKVTLKPEGILILTMPYYGYIKNLLISILNKWDQHHSSLVSYGHIKFFSMKSIKRLLIDNGFAVVKCYGVGRRIPYLWNTMLVVAKPLREVKELR
jgi:SAM-dependent methyltransferase